MKCYRLRRGASPTHGEMAGHAYEEKHKGTLDDWLQAILKRFPDAKGRVQVEEVERKRGSGIDEEYPVRAAWVTVDPYTTMTPTIENNVLASASFSQGVAGVGSRDGMAILVAELNLRLDTVAWMEWLSEGDDKYYQMDGDSSGLGRYPSSVAIAGFQD